MKQKGLKYVDDIDDICCPECNEPIDKEQANWDFMDEETRIVKCKCCQYTFKVIINRPIEFVVGRIIDF